VIKMELKEKARLMRVRHTLKENKHSFVRFESWRYKKLSKSGWKKQRGIDNKTRRKTKTGVKSPHPGYRGPKDIRGIHPSGLRDVLVTNVEELEGLNPKFQGVRIATKLGIRKKMALIEKAQEKGFHIFNTGFLKEDLTDLETPMVDDQEEKTADDNVEDAEIVDNDEEDSE